MSGTDLERPIGAPVEEEPVGFELEMPEVEERQGFSFDLGFLRTRTGAGTVEERINHPLNFSHSKGVAQIIRGLEGFFDSLDLAIIDIVMGVVEVIKEKRVAGAN